MNLGISYRLYHPFEGSRELFNRKAVSSTTKPTKPLMQPETFIIGSNDKKSRVVQSAEVKFIRPSSAFEHHPIQIKELEKEKVEREKLKRALTHSAFDIRRPQSGNSGQSRAPSVLSRPRSGASTLNRPASAYSDKLSRPQSSRSVASARTLMDEFGVVGQTAEYNDPFPKWLSTTDTRFPPMKLEKLMEDFMISGKLERLPQTRSLVERDYDLIE
jgi:hypothetical protein